MINFVNVDTTPSDDWSSYRIASNASLTVCFVMIGTSLAIAGSGEVVIIIAAVVVVVNDIVEEAIVAAMNRLTKFRRVLTMELNSVDDDDDDNDEMSRLKELSSDDDAALIMEIVSHPPSLAHPIRVEDTPPQ